MIIGIPKEPIDETRISITLQNAKKLIALGNELIIEQGSGESLGIANKEYIDLGAKIELRNNVLSKADIVLRLKKPNQEEISIMKKGAISISYLDPFNNQMLLEEFAKQNITAISMEMIPRISRAQKMDALSSQASLAGYAAVIIATERSKKILPMMMTPAGTISPSKVFIIGAGVAGLQAIATAKRLGARVEAFDTRQVVEEQVKSLGAKFVKIDLGETGETSQGYAKELTSEQLAKQRELMADHCAQADIVITTALIFGKIAPVLITKETVARMQKGSIIIDMAVESGGNVEGSVLNEEVSVNGVKIIGLSNLPGHVAYNASSMYSNNLIALFEEFYDKESKTFKLNLHDEILKGCVMTHNGKIVHATFNKEAKK